jgi:hypothetical protein
MANQSVQQDTCEICRYWINKKGKRDGYDGDCRKNPPTVISDDCHAIWPDTRATDWCGEWKEASK